MTSGRVVIIWIIVSVYVAAIAIAGCAQQPKPAPPTVVIAGCEHFKPISASRRDTDETKEQILAHNAEYAKACGK